MDDAELVAAYKGKSALIVGGTRGVGKGISDRLTAAGAKVVDVGRSATPPGIAADLSTIAGCHAFVKLLEKKGTCFDFVVFTIGVWPDVPDRFTHDGVDKVLMLDLLARHIVLTGLISTGLLSDSCRVMCVLASCQYYPPSMMDATSVRSRLTAGVVTDEEREVAAGSRVTPRRIADGVLMLFTTSVAHDAWLRHVGAKLPAAPAVLVSTFPGLVATDLPQTALPGWLARLGKCLMLPIAESAEQTGRHHASILASDAVTRCHVSHFVSPLLRAHRAHGVAYDAELGEWVFQFLDKLAADSDPAPDAIPACPRTDDVVVPPPTLA